MDQGKIGRKALRDAMAAPRPIVVVLPDEEADGMPAPFAEPLPQRWKDFSTKRTLPSSGTNRPYRLLKD